MRAFLRSVFFTLLTAHLATATAQVPVLNSYPAAPAVILLDFDGIYLDGTVWNFSGPLTLNSSGLSNTQITEAFNRVAEDYRPFNINITTEESRYAAAPADKRMRVIISTSYEWYGSGAGGVAYVGSFKWGDGTPCFVFSSLLGMSVKNIAEAVSHEAGHTLGLRHQSSYDGSCNKLSDYNWGQGSGEIGWAPIMGAGYYQNLTVWHNGPNSFGCNNTQSDLDIITSTYNGFGYRNDDRGNDFTASSLASFDTNGLFTINGVIERTSDVDFFKFVLPVFGNFTLDAIPYNVGTGNAGSDLDLKIDLYDQYQNLVGTFNPGNELNSIIDTILSAGTYYISVDGYGNMYASDYGSLGSYSLQASYTDGSLLPLRSFGLEGFTEGNLHRLQWSYTTQETVTGHVIEYSNDGRHFQELVSLATDQHNYAYYYNGIKAVQYRVAAWTAEGKKFYSNIIRFRAGNLDKPRLIGNTVTTELHINSPSAMPYLIMDNSGRILQKGTVSKGYAKLNTDFLPVGIFLIHFAGEQGQWTEKFVKSTR